MIPLTPKTGVNGINANPLGEILDLNNRRNKFKLLDLFCGGGGASMGYYRAGFEVVGVDIKKQPRYPFDFVQGDALILAPEMCQYFDVIHASPPCQFASVITPKEYKKNHPNLISATREVLQNSGKFYVIENVPGAKEHLTNPLLLCGTFFGLNLWRHRFFEIKPRIAPPIAKCDHSKRPILITGSPKRNGQYSKEPNAQQQRDAMQTSWMRKIDMDEAIPPAYTEWIGRELISLLNKEKSKTKRMFEGVSGLPTNKGSHS